MYWNINVIVTSIVTGIRIYVSVHVLVFIKLEEHVSEWYPEDTHFSQNETLFTTLVFYEVLFPCTQILIEI